MIYFNIENMYSTFCNKITNLNPDSLCTCIVCIANNIIAVYAKQSGFPVPEKLKPSMFPGLFEDQNVIVQGTFHIFVMSVQVKIKHFPSLNSEIFDCKDQWESCKLERLYFSHIHMIGDD